MEVRMFLHRGSVEKVLHHGSVEGCTKQVVKHQVP